MRPSRSACSILVPALIMIAMAALFTGCGKATVRPLATDPGFTMALLRQDSAALNVSEHVQVNEFNKPFDEFFGSGSALAARLSARLLDSLNHGTPSLSVRSSTPAVAALWPKDSAAAGTAEDLETAWQDQAPKFILRIHNLTVGNHREAIPATMIPSGPQGGMAPATGGENVACMVTFDVEVWEKMNEDGLAGLTRRAAFTVTGKANVVLFANKMALEEAISAAVRGTLAQLRQ